MPNRPTGTSVVRAINARAALRVLLDNEALTRPEIATLLGVSKPTASHLLSQLREMALVKSDGNRDGMIGRAAELFSIDPSAAHMAALDVTPERISAAVIDFTGTLRSEFVLPTPIAADADAAEQTHAALTAACAPLRLSPAQLRHVVIGIQGAVDPATDQLHFAAHLPGWQQPGLALALHERIGARISIENDVNLAAIAEQAHGTAAGSDSFVLLWISDGIGMGLMFGGALHRGLTGGAGEISDMPIPGAPTVSESAEYGTNGMQAFAGAPALAEVLRAHGFTGATAEETLQNAIASSSDSAAQALAEIAHRLALGLSAVVAIVDPALIVLAGSLARAGSERLRELIQAHLHTLVTARTPVELSHLEGNPVLTGGLWLALSTTHGEILDSVSSLRRSPTAT